MNSRLETISSKERCYDFVSEQIKLELKTIRSLKIIDNLISPHNLVLVSLKLNSEDDSSYSIINGKLQKEVY
jgi:hypothetical protein